MFCRLKFRGKCKKILVRISSGRHMIPPFLKFRKVGNSDGLFENLGATNGGELKINPWISRTSSSMVSLKKRIFEILNWKLSINSGIMCLYLLSKMTILSWSSLTCKEFESLGHFAVKQFLKLSIISSLSTGSSLS